MWGWSAAAWRRGVWGAALFMSFTVACAAASPTLAGNMSAHERLSAISRVGPAVGDPGETIYDASLNITWLADADLASSKCFGVKGINKDGSMDYQTAVKWVAAMNAHDCLDHNTWTLPTTPAMDSGCSSTGSHGNSFGYGCSRSAMGSLYYTSLGLPEPDTAVPVPSSSVGPFRDFQPYLYWTRTGAGKKGHSAFSFNTGWTGSNVSPHNMYVLPMVPGNPFHTPIPVGGKGLYASADGKTVYDATARVTWLADADLATAKRFGVTGINRDGSMQHRTAVRWIKAMNKATWLGKNHWQLPASGKCSGFDCTTGPLGELYYHGILLTRGQPVVATPDTSLHGFRDLQPYLYWSCAAHRIQGPCHGYPAPESGWSFSFGNGFEGTDLMHNDLFVTAYYPGGTTTTTPPPTCKPPPPDKPITCM